jgi:hypothetical protein
MCLTVFTLFFDVSSFAQVSHLDLRMICQCQTHKIILSVLNPGQKSLITLAPGLVSALPSCWCWCLDSSAGNGHLGLNVHMEPLTGLSQYFPLALPD